MITFTQLQEIFQLADLEHDFFTIVATYKQGGISFQSCIQEIQKLLQSTPIQIHDEIAEYAGYTSHDQDTLQGAQINDALAVYNPTQLPDIQNITSIFEPYVSLDIISPEIYLGKIIELVNESRGEVIHIEALSQGQIQIHTRIPLAEIIINFYDDLKSLTKGYASMNYEFFAFKKGDLVKLDIMLNGKVIEPLSTIKHKTRVVNDARHICEKLKELIPRQQIEIAIQGAVNSHIVARETIKPYRKDVTAGLYGGDISRRKKLLDKQKKGKKRMKSFGSVDVPKEVFVQVLKH